ncbi:MAG: tripartite tricarboxylate transporter substrate binding protein [Desulfarculaceae bacterium]|nr:tripartite tricarboxylate transporter substrate binding protein [Desulfarculaceae bacterium]MCF8047048.1 tripartite tricarboxylate transporter substrate binding protein [Desulfarculaceae bacterium]MCF8065795.1 tripartite tricarboxylate transporter substrate binding protein [Desulfarculaceae bacterium]MCF8097262.1 tripartite tricarboxylate transporter substrate binding protein [Desulfarculaceae bacterium]MCF8122155.1 tripartite tricarboxylate transporter substrate binding protein [Desulfarcul
MKSMKFFTRFAAVALAAALVLACSMPAMAEDYPDKPISMIVTYSPGGATDFQARIVTMMAGQDKYLGQPIVIINKPGAGGQVGWNWFVQKGSKDGYTIASYNVPHFIAQSIVYPTKYDINAFEPVANWGADPAVLIVPKDSPFNNVKDFVAYAKKNPGKITVSGAGMYVGHHIATLQLMKAAGIKLTYIPEKGGVPAMQSVVSGKVKAGFNNLSDSFRNKDRIKILAVADLERHDFLPDVPTFKENGIDVDNSSVNYRGVILPKGAPPAVIAKLAEAFPKMFNDKKTLKKMKASGSPVKVMTRDQVIKMFKERQAYLEGLLAELKKKK